MATRRRTSASKTARSATKSIKESTISVKKVTTPPANSVNKVTQPKVKKVIDPTDTAPVIINLPEGTNLKKVVRTPAESPQNKDLDLQKLFKDYPRDGFALALLPLLLLEALTKEGLKLAGVSV